MFPPDPPAEWVAPDDELRYLRWIYSKKGYLRSVAEPREKPKGRAFGWTGRVVSVNGKRDDEICKAIYEYKCLHLPSKPGDNIEQP